MRVRPTIKGALRETLDHFRGHPGRLASLAVALIAGAAAGWPVQQALYSYTWADAEFCNDCHVHDYANQAYGRSLHAGLTTCHDCHLVPIRHYPKNLYVTLFDPPEGPEDMHPPEVESVICAQCHVEGEEAHLTGPMTEDIRARLPKIGEAPAHKAHLEAETEDGEPIICVDCHGSEPNRAHTFEVQEDNCIACHEGFEQGPHALGHIQCRSCHYRSFVTE